MWATSRLVEGPSSGSFRVPNSIVGDVTPFLEATATAATVLAVANLVRVALEHGPDRTRIEP